MSSPMTYERLGKDGLAEIVNLKLGEIAKNIRDVNTNPKQERKLTIEVKFKPDEARAFANTTYQVKANLASVKAVAFPALMDEDGLYMHDVGNEPDQYELPDTNHNVRHIKWAIANKKLHAPSPMAGYKLKRGETEKLIPPTPKEVEALLKHAPDHLIRAISLAYYLGVRVGPSELLRIQWNHLELDTGIATIISAKKGGDPWRRLHIKPEFLDILRKWQAEDEKSGMDYCVHYNGGPISCLKRSWAKTKLKAGITRRMRPYDLRHAFATYALEAGADVGAVAHVMGHRDTAMIHRHYQHVLDAQKRQVTASIPSIKIPQNTEGKEEKKVHFEVHNSKKNAPKSRTAKK